MIIKFQYFLNNYAFRIRGVSLQIISGSPYEMLQPI